MKVLIIDDDVIDHELNTRILEVADNTFCVKSSYNGQEGFQYISEHLHHSKELPDVILLDMNMPVLDGWGFLEQFKSISFSNGRIPSVYILSSQEVDENRAMEYQVAGLYSKPLNFRAISQIVQRFNEN